MVSANVNSTGATRFMQSQHIIVPFRKVSCLVGFSPGFDEINFILPDYIGWVPIKRRAFERESFQRDALQRWTPFRVDQ